MGVENQRWLVPDHRMIYHECEYYGTVVTVAAPLTTIAKTFSLRPPGQALHERMEGLVKFKLTTGAHRWQGETITGGTANVQARR